MIIFNIDKLTPHEALVQASQQYNNMAMAKDDWPYAISHDMLKCFLFADVNYFPEWKLYTTEVAFNPTGLDHELDECKFIWCNHIKNTLWEFMFIHVWSYFFLNVQQPNPEAELHYSELMSMKYIFLDKMEDDRFNTEIKGSPPHLEAYEHWFALNRIVRLSYLKEKGLTWKSHFNYLKNPTGD